MTSYRTLADADHKMFNNLNFNRSHTAYVAYKIHRKDPYSLLVHLNTLRKLKAPFSFLRAYMY